MSSLLSLTMTAKKKKKRKSLYPPWRHFEKSPPCSQLKLLDPVAMCIVLFLFSFCAICLACPEYLGSAVLLWASLVSLLCGLLQNKGKGDRDTGLLSAIVQWRFFRRFGFDARFIRQHSKDSREIGIYLHKSNWQGKVSRERRDAVRKQSQAGT